MNDLHDALIQAGWSEDLIKYFVEPAVQPYEIQTAVAIQIDYKDFSVPEIDLSVVSGYTKCVW